ncbi:MAG: MATE family efflux transporter [Motiliproteus sp.]|nr:MATE family efflux transporter [Motiliproteus sp.]MCW9054219.1 MATE family efflux transporter [Motiliproteus sp.]
MSTRSQIKFTEGPVGSQLLRATLPMVWAILALMSFNAADTFFIAQLGEAPLAAITFTFPVVMVLTSIAIGLGAGTSTAVAQAIGTKQIDLARRLTTDATSLCLLLSVVLAIAGLLSIAPLFRILGAEEHLLPLIREYMQIWYLSVPGLIAPMVCMSALRANGLSKVQSYIMISASLANIALDPILIFGLFGVPRLELAGAAIATLSVRSCTLLVALYVAYRVGMLSNPLAPLRQLWHSWKRILHVGLPATATNVIIPLATGLVVKLVAEHGTSAVAGFGIASRIEILALVFFYALSSMVGPFIGQNLAAGKYQRVQQTLTSITRFSMIGGALLALVLWLAGDFIASQFNDSAEVRWVAVSYLTIVPISYGCYGLIMSINAAFNGLAKPLPATLISSSRVLIIYLPLAYLGQYFWGLTGLFFAAMAANMLVAIVGYYWLRRTLDQLSTN